MAAGGPLRAFTFWEPRGAVTPWLQLCRETWRRGLSGTEIVTLDHANLGDYLPSGTIDLATVKKLPFMHQKDAIMVAILHRHGGLFIDMDTIIVDDMAPVLRTLDRASMFNYGGNLSVVGARAGSELLDRWLELSLAQVALISSGAMRPEDSTWDFVAYRSLDAALAELHDRAPHRKLIRGTAPGRALWSLAARTKPNAGGGGSLVRRIPRRIEWELSRRSMARHRVQLDPSTFFAELQGPAAGSSDHNGRYMRFWFDEALPVEAVVRPGVRVVGLHNSWMPAWYAALPRDEVLAHPSLLSRTLGRLLAA